MEQESAVFMPHSMIQAINRIDSDDFVVQGNALLFDLELNGA